MQRPLAIGAGLGVPGGSHFGGQPIHIPKVSQNPLEFDPPAFCRHRAQAGEASLTSHSATWGGCSPATVGVAGGALGSVGVGGQAEGRQTERGPSMASVPRHPLRDPGGLRSSESQDRKRCPPASPCWVCIPSPFPSLGGGRAGRPCLQEEEPGLPVTPEIFREREREPGCWLCGATLLSGSIRRWGPWGRKQLQAADDGGARGGRQTPQLTQFVVGRPL